MNTEQAKKAIKQGKSLQYKGLAEHFFPKEWEDFGESSHQYLNIFTTFQYRIKPSKKKKP